MREKGRQQALRARTAGADEGNHRSDGSFVLSLFVRLPDTSLSLYRFLQITCALGPSVCLGPSFHTVCHTMMSLSVCVCLSVCCTPVSIR